MSNQKLLVVDQWLTNSTECYQMKKLGDQQKRKEGNKDLKHTPKIATSIYIVTRTMYLDYTFDFCSKSVIF